MTLFLRRCAKRWQLFVFLIPAVAYILIFAYYPMFGVQIAFRNYTPKGGIWNSAWVGLKHFQRFFASFQFSRVLINTLRVSVYSLLVNFPLAVVMALAMNTVRNVFFKKTVQTVTYMPHFISIVVLVGMLTQMFNPVMGMYGNLYRIFAGSGYPKDLLTQAAVFPHLYVWSGTWQNLGWSTIIYMAALSSVDLELHEAAQIDGATRLGRVVHIDLPALLPTASIMLILNAGSIMSVGFEKAYLMQNTTNLSTAEVISTYVYKVGMSQGTTQFSYAAAIGLFNSAVNCFMLVVFNLLSRKINNDGASLF
ncbi:MAG TPA: ABC transporter permease subunit [Clostridia bacterium]|nr:ABC transporter permease subunit [Clostridia bacterium]